MFNSVLEHNRIADEVTRAYCLLATAVLLQAARDAKSAHPGTRGPAVHFLTSPWAAFMLESLGVDPEFLPRLAATDLPGSKLSLRNAL